MCSAESQGGAYHFPPKKLHALARPHRQCSGSYVAEGDVCLSSHLFRLEGVDVKDYAVSGEKGIEG